ncbi:aminopeptidase N isoform X2 [Drosophila subobscura]|uniref:aminopeptidase N isoform X2 n=1 Tax=Drosophila subobscura TaxID=7241 RepID=UPI00155AA015|nr:aminopeptidase N isoform X2 [Drosophila subobscura]
MFVHSSKYTVANELNLFDYLQAELLEDEHFGQQPWVLRVREIMLSWTHSEWMPIVLVTRNYENDTITFSQRSIHSKSEHWWIPLNFATAQKPCFEETQADLFIPPQTQHSLSLAELNLQLTGRDWLIVNKQQTGFYHVHYDTDNLRAISRQLRHNHTLIHPVNRAALFRDLKPQIEHTELEDIDVVFDMLKYMEFEEDLLPWNQVADTIDFVRRNLFATSSLELFNEFVRQLVTPTFRRLFRDKASGEVPNSDLDAGQAILLMACLADLPECLEYTRTLAKEYIFKRINVTNESEYFAMYDSILCLGVRYLSDKDFYGVIGMMQAADRSSIYYDDLIYSLRCTQSHSHLLYFLELLLGENSTHLILSDPESMMYLSYLYKSNMEARSVIWQYIDRNYKLLCRSPNFVENFNQIAEFVPRQQKPQFVLLRQNIAAYMEVQGLNHTGAALIDIDSGLVGKKMKNTEIFVDKYEQKIHNWLMAEVPQMTAQKEAIYAASLSVGNGSNRPQGLLNTASEVVQKALRSIDRSLYR